MEAYRDVQRQELALPHTHARIRLGQRVNGHRALPRQTLFVRTIDSVAELIAAEHDADIVHEWGLQSFPASDPPANW